METLKFLLTSTFFPPYHIGGDAIHVGCLAQELTRLGHKVNVLHSIDAYELKRKSIPKESGDTGIYVYSIKSPLHYTSYLAYLFGGSPLVERKFKFLVNEIKPDIVHHHNISLLSYRLLGKRSNYFNLYTAHDFWLVCQQNNLLKNGEFSCDDYSCLSCSIRRRRFPQVWRSFKGFKEVVDEIDCMIAPSDYLRNKISAQIPVRIETIPNFVPRPPLNIGKSGFSNFFLYAGVLEKHKGILNLINLFADPHIESNLLIAGQGSLMPSIKASINKLGLEKKIILLGWTNHDLLYRLLNDANALIVPSICPENNPLIILEAFSMGCPVIASRIGGIPEIVQKLNKNLVYEDLNTLRQLIMSFSKKEFSPEHIKSIYSQNYSPEAYVKKYFEKLNRCGS